MQNKILLEKLYMCEEAVHLVNSTHAVVVQVERVSGVPRHIHSSLSFSLDGQEHCPK